MTFHAGKTIVSLCLAGTQLVASKKPFSICNIIVVDLVSFFIYFLHVAIEVHIANNFIEHEPRVFSTWI